MKRAIVLAVLCVGLVGIAMMNNARGVARDAANGGVSTVDAKAKPISDLAWLVGGVWTADASKMGEGMKRIETRYGWSDKPADMQADLIRKTNDKYQWVLEEKSGETWKQLATLEYVRTAE